MPYSKVLVPVGGENILERGQKALSHAIPLCAGEIILLNVPDPLPSTVGGEAREAMLREELPPRKRPCSRCWTALPQPESPAGSSWKTAPWPTPSSEYPTNRRPISSSCSPTDAMMSAAC